VPSLRGHYAARESEGALPEIDDRLLAEVQLLYRDYEAYLKLGTELGGEGKPEAAAYEESLGINPRLSEAEARLIYLYTRLGQPAKAEEHFRAIAHWVLRYAPILSQRIRCEMRKPNRSWRVDETYVRVAGRWAYLYRAVDSDGARLISC